MQNPKKILILVPAITARGGITNYYQVLKDEFPETVEYFIRGSRTWPVRNGIFELFRALKDYHAFKKRIAKRDIQLVQTSTSLGLVTMIRDGMFVKRAQKKGIKTIVFFRGWDESAAKMANKYLFLFKYYFFNSDKFITLSESAKEILKQWGYNKEILVETTVVDKNLLQCVNKNSLTIKNDKLKKNNMFKLLYVSRIEYQKGIFELLEAFKKLSQSPSELQKFSLVICGDGFELENIKKYILNNELKNTYIKGFIQGDQKREAFEDADLFIFPSHSEGMPNAVLEAMGFGLPVITTPVGGLIDFFVSGKHGLYIEKKNSNDILNKITRLASDDELLLEIALNNYEFAKNHFRSDIVAKRILEIFNNTIIN